MTTLVTGATGFVGAAVARNLERAGHDLRLLVRRDSPDANLKDLAGECVVGDLNDADSLRAAVQGCDSLFHVAADYRLWARDPAEIYRTNVDGSRTLLRAAAEAGVGRMVFTSSVATLALHPDGTPSQETDAGSLEAMTGDYKRSKFLAEQMVLELVRDEQLPIVLVSPAAPIGPGDVKPTPTGKTVLDAARGRMPAFVDTGLSLVHVDDVAEGHRLAFERGEVGRNYILGGENLSLQEILQLVAELCGTRAARIRIPHGLVFAISALTHLWARLSGGEPAVPMDAVRMSSKRMYFSSRRAVEELGYAPRPARDALRDAIEWFNQHGYE